jgi:hypothetical protein
MPWTLVCVQAALFVVVVLVRSQGAVRRSARIADSATRGRAIRRSIVGGLTGGAFAFVVVGLLGIALATEYQRERRQENDLGGLVVFALAMFCFLVVLPLVSWGGLYLLRARPAGLAILWSWALFGFPYVVFWRPSNYGTITSAWFDAILAAGGYAIGCAAAVALPETAAVNVAVPAVAATGRPGTAPLVWRRPRAIARQPVAINLAVLWGVYIGVWYLLRA